MARTERWPVDSERTLDVAIHCGGNPVRMVRRTPHRCPACSLGPRDGHYQMWPNQHAGNGQSCALQL